MLDVKLHLLSQELIPNINDLDNEPKQVVLNHVNTCTECQRLYSRVVDFKENFPESSIAEDVQTKPLKKLVQFNKGLKLLLVAVRFIILFYIIFTSIDFYVWESSPMAAIQYIQSGIFLFYLPAIIFLLVFTATFFNRRWFWFSLATDTMVILFFVYVLKLFTSL